ncbi:hypothetical protein D1872_309150 [compost metagenome]
MLMIKSAERHPRQRAEIVGMHWRSKLCQQRWRRNNAAGNFGEQDGYRGRIDFGSHANRTVDIIAQKIHRSVIEFPLD